MDADGKILASHHLRGGVQRRRVEYGLSLTNQRVPKGCAATASIATTSTAGNIPGSAVALLGLFPRPAGNRRKHVQRDWPGRSTPFVVEVLC